MTKKTTKASNPGKDQMIEELMTRLGFEVTYARGRDALDFKDCSVIGIREALEKAYEAGFAKGKNSK